MQLNGAACCNSVVRLTGILFLVMSCFAQKDPGPRGAPAAAGGAVSGLSPDLITAFQTGLAQFTQVEMVSDGLGPRFNSNSCSSCHAQPAVGGTSPGAGGIVTPNPQVLFASLHNPLPAFITTNGQ